MTQVSNVLTAFGMNNTSKTGKSSNFGTTDFQAVLNVSSSGETTNNAPNLNTRSEMKKTDSTAPPRKEKLLKKDLKVSKKEGPKDETQLTKEEIEKMSELLNAEGQNIINEISSRFDIPVEDIIECMNELSLEPMDLLNPNNLKDLVPKLFEDDPLLPLLTDGKAFEEFSSLIDSVKDRLTSISKELDIPVRKLEMLVDDFKDLNLGRKIYHPGPVIEKLEPMNEKKIEVEKTDEDFEVDSKDNPEEVVLKSGPEFEEGFDKSGVEEHTSGQNPKKKDDKSEKTSPFEKSFDFTSKVDLKERIVLPETEKLSSARTLETENIMNQILERMKVSVSEESTNLTMQLHPESLGTISVQLKSQGGNITASFIAQNENVKAVLENGLIELKESFANQGIEVNSIEVSIASQSFDQDFNRENEKNSSGEENKNKRFRSLGEIDALDGFKDLSEEILEEQMIIEKGGTVEFTA